jgi:hypothetical protein
MDKSYYNPDEMDKNKVSIPMKWTKIIVGK